jgi:nitrate/TMAO reductase-like tetraheme cytochrome c subunit
VAPIRHPTGRRFAGSAACAECHQASYDVWKESGHAQALTTLETQSPRRDGDPECLSCHVVGWVPQKYEPFEGGFAGMAVTPHLAHQGCENCHGPAATHTAVERGDVKATDEQRDRLRSDLALSLATPEERERAVNNCLECHDLDNSPKFDFDTYWPMIEHSEKDTPDSK